MKIELCTCIYANTVCQSSKSDWTKPWYRLLADNYMLDISCLHLHRAAGCSPFAVSIIGDYFPKVSTCEVLRCHTREMAFTVQVAPS